MARYVFSDDEPIILKGATKANPQLIGETLEKIRSSNNGDLRPEAVIDSAKSTRSPLHKHFEWDDAEAAYSFRIQQARALIRIVRLIDDDSEEPVRAFISLRGKDGLSYRATSEIKTSLDLQEVVLAQAERELEAFERRYRELQEICTLIREARNMINERRLARSESRPAQ